MVSFVGIAREINKKNKIKYIEIEHYPKMAKKKIKEVEKKATKKWKLNDCIIIHRYGKIFSGENIVYVATSAEHRLNAFRACEYIIDYLKVDAPFWKLEKTKSRNIEVKATKKDKRKLRDWNLY